MTDGYPPQNEEQSSFKESYESLEMGRCVLSDKPLRLAIRNVLTYCGDLDTKRCLRRGSGSSSPRWKEVRHDIRFLRYV